MNKSRNKTMTYKELQAKLKEYKIQGLTTIKLNSKQALLQQEYDRLAVNNTWQDKAKSTVNRLLDGEEMTINKRGGGTAKIRYHHRGTPVNFLEIRDSDNKTQRPIMTREALDKYVFDLYNPKLDKIMGCANPRFEEVTAKQVTPIEPSKHFTVSKSKYRKGYCKVQIHDINETGYKRKQEWLLENLGCNWNSREGYLIPESSINKLAELENYLDTPSAEIPYKVAYYYAPYLKGTVRGQRKVSLNTFKETFYQESILPKLITGEPINREVLSDYVNRPAVKQLLTEMAS